MFLILPLFLCTSCFCFALDPLSSPDIDTIAIQKSTTITKSTNKEKIARHIKELAPGITSVKNIKFLTESHENILWKASSNKGPVVLRKRRFNMEPLRYEKVINISKACHHLGLGPKVFGWSQSPQECVIEYIPSKNSGSYQKVMRLLRNMHDSLKEKKSPPPEEIFIPFNLIFRELKKLHTEELPHQFKREVQILFKIYDSLLPWLRKHAVMCHGDLHKGNVICKQKTGRLVFIDFDFVRLGHPYFDIVKFSGVRKKKRSLQLLKYYLQRTPTTEEKKHLRLMALCSKIRTSIKYFYKAQINNSSSNRLSKKEMESLLSKNSRLSLNNLRTARHITTRDWQLHALKTLKNILQETKNWEVETSAKASVTKNT